MGFSPDVAEKALVASGRHCCLCRQFKGSKVETHHIVQPSDGGDNSFDNCIPLCFDCHADVKSYNKKHPKGRKFSPSELKSHRDTWYKIWENSAPSSQYIDTNISKEKAINILKRQIKRIKTIKDESNGSPKHIKWKRDTSIAVEKIFGNESTHIKEFRQIIFSVIFESTQTKKEAYKMFYTAGLNKAEMTLKSFIDEINDYWE